MPWMSQQLIYVPLKPYPSRKPAFAIIFSLIPVVSLNFSFVGFTTRSHFIRVTSPCLRHSIARVRGERVASFALN